MNKNEILKGEEMWASEAIDDTQSLAIAALSLIEDAIQSNIKFDNLDEIRQQLLLGRDTATLDFDFSLLARVIGSLHKIMQSEKTHEVIEKLRLWQQKYGEKL